MGPSIKMQGIHQVLIPFEGILGCKVYVLGPRRAADKDDSIFVPRTDGLYNFFCIRLHICPSSAAVWLVADFIKDVGVLFVFFCHFFEEGNGFFFINFWVAVA